ncbi:MAG: hypothetical protein RLY58_2243 [Pseudomonadota bacterium]|jgi:hypothetical protein
MKKLDQSVFNGQPECMKWAFVNESGVVWVTSKKPRLGKSKTDSNLKCFYTFGDGVQAACVDGEYDADNWQHSLILRSGGAQ